MSISKILFLFFFAHSVSYSQVRHSLYIGTGFNTNLGGEIGIGTELHFKKVSFNLALGASLPKEDLSSVTGEQSRFDYDIGLKLHLFHNFHFGLNYGLIAARLYTKGGQEKLHFEKNHGFSYTVVYRQDFFKHFNWLIYFGITSKSEENYWQVFRINGSKKYFAPRLGFLLAYYL